MQDILIEQQSDGTFDIEFENGDFKSTTGLDTAIIMSLFIDKRATGPFNSVLISQPPILGE